MKGARLFPAAGAFSGLTVILLGAFGAHGLQDVLEPKLMSAYEKGVDYQALHSLLLLVIGQLLSNRSERCFNWAGYLTIAGILLFSGSLYLMAVTGYRPLGIVTPFGGTAFVLAWGCLLKGILKQE